MNQSLTDLIRQYEEAQENISWLRGEVVKAEKEAARIRNQILSATKIDKTGVVVRQSTAIGKHYPGRPLLDTSVRQLVIDAIRTAGSEGMTLGEVATHIQKPEKSVRNNLNQAQLEGLIVRHSDKRWRWLSVDVSTSLKRGSVLDLLRTATIDADHRAPLLRHLGEMQATAFDGDACRNYIAARVDEGAPRKVAISEVMALRRLMQSQLSESAGASSDRIGGSRE